jgi:hypothetical protein
MSSQEAKRAAVVRCLLVKPGRMAEEESGKLKAFAPRHPVYLG